MVEQFAAPPINTIVSIRPLSTPTPNRDALASPTPLANLPPGTTIEGFVVNRDAANNPILRTPLGDLQMQSSVFVKTGSAMVIRVDATAETRARIITIDGLPPQDYAAKNTRALAQDTIVTSPLLQRAPGAAPGTAPLPQGQPGLQGMLLGNTHPASANPLFMQLPGAGAVLPTGLLKLQAGAALKVQLLSMELPKQIDASRSNAAVKPGGIAPQPNSANAPAPQPGQSASKQPAVSSGSQQPIDRATMASPEAARAAQQTAPTAPQPAASTPAGRVPMMTPGPVQANPPLPQAVVAQANPAVAPHAAPGMPGLVIGHEADGGSIVQTGFGMLKIYTPTPLPVHTRLTLDVQPGKATPPAPNLAPTTPLAEEGDGLSSLSRVWPHLSEAVSWLAAQEAGSGRAPLQMLPEVGPKLASGLLFFLAAVKGGDIRQWMGGKNFDRLELKMPELAGKLRGEMSQLQQLFLHSPLDQWTGVMLPMLHGNQIDYAKLYLRDEQEDGKDAQNKAREQRFIVEIELSHLGEMQFDGFVRQTSPKKQFDLMIRTSRPLDVSVSGDIRNLFETTLATTGYNGYLGFQQGTQHFVRPLAGNTSSSQRPTDSHAILA